MKQLKLLLFFTLFCMFGLSVFAQYDNLYIIGGPFNSDRGGNWQFRDVIELEKDSENPYVFYYRGYIGYNTFGDEPGNFKILINKESWGGYHPAGETNQPIGASQVGVTLNIREGGDDTKWTIPADGSGNGYYDIKIDTDNNTFLIENFTPAATEVPVGLFLIGGPFIIDDLTWGDLVDAVKMERDDTNPDVFHFKGYMEHNQWGNERGNFKILKNIRSWDQQFQPAGGENVSFPDITVGQPSTIALNNSTDTKWYLPEDGSGNGYWDFTVDAKNETLTINQFTQDLDYFNEVYITGDAMPGGWTDTEPEVMTKESRGIYTWTGTINAGEFKFLKYKSYSGGSYVAGTEDETVVIGEPNTIIYEKNYMMHDSGNDYKFIIAKEDDNKEVTITLDLIENKMTVENKSTTNIEQNKDIIISILAQTGKVVINGTANENYTARVFSLTGTQIMQKTFAGNTEMALPQGYYLVTLSNESGIVTQTKVMVF